ncbi:MAG: GNAT family N-acetyltransferase [Moraxella sp.]|nr:GNAT family N-acetyltransferase [Moraxella sp.]
MTLLDLTKDDVRLRVATLADVPSLEKLLNRCYRNDEGWTNEAHLIGGIRTTASELTNLINKDNSYLFVFVSPTKDTTDDTALLACISVEFTTMHHKKVAYIGTFAVAPELQGKGIGNTLLSAVETFAARHASSHQLDGFAMSILSHRPELLAYYQRRGYQTTKHTMPFPEDGNNGEPKQVGLLLEWLFKAITV